MFIFICSCILKRNRKVDGFLRGNIIENAVYKYCKEKEATLIGSMKIPLAIPAVDINTAQTILFVSDRTFLEDTKDTIYIDGFNLIITLEVALSKGTLIRGSDGCIRDLAGLRGTYRIIDKTSEAIRLIASALEKLQIAKATFYLDSPVSNSGMLKTRILDYDWKFEVEVELVPNTDRVLAEKDRVVTGDSIVLNKCKGWFNLGTRIVEEYVDNPWIVDLS